MTRRRAAVRHTQVVPHGLWPFLVMLFVIGARAAGHPADQRPASAWTLVWSDEFNDPDGTAPNPSRWSYDLGGQGWGNQELQSYTNRANNVVIRDGRLLIIVRRESYTGADGVRRGYTSARLHTRNRFATAYGRFEARIRVPAGNGLWPAFWMLGNDFTDSGWPDCGEIDIVEHITNEPSTVRATLHGPGYSHRSGISHSFTLPGGTRFTDDFHVFAMEWESQVIRFYVDSMPFATTRASDLPPGKKWVFDHPFFLLLNVAVGGDWPGDPDPQTRFPQTMQVDYVRVYQRHR